MPNRQLQKQGLLLCNSPCLLFRFGFLFCVQGIHNDVRVGVGDDGPVGVVNHHAGLATQRLFHLLDGGHIHRQVLAALGLGVLKT